MPAKRNDYLGNEQSKEIRDISLDMIAAFEALLSGKADIRDRAYAQLLKSYEQLTDMIITPDMNTGLPQSAYNDPVVAAEYLAGQLLEERLYVFSPPSTVKRSIEEWNESEQEGVALFSTETMPDIVQQFIVCHEVILWIAESFDRSKEEKEERKWK